MRLLRLSWLLQLATEGTAVHKEFTGVLNRRQDLPDEAFIDVEELKQIERGAKWGISHLEEFLVELFVDAIAGPGGFLTRLVRVICNGLMLRGLSSGRNSDGLLPVVAVSYVCHLNSNLSRPPLLG